ncbi:4-amino-4-deoxy-L-arabinose-phospho-UDP flippase [Stutzerimonas chloritidismutans]|uniref:4-amino-4-deoxy-L-arabinose-phospho-UDP flippase n=1 Tax=Stutzerimonas chloritidismutans TaxID=203192 RepID=UPI00384E4543
MTFVQFVLTLATVISLSVGQILFKLASAEIDFSSSKNFYGLLDFRLFVALAVYGVATFMWLMVLKITPLRVAYPFTALAFILVPIMGHVFLNERLVWTSFVGALFIGVGVWVSVLK